MQQKITDVDEEMKLLRCKSEPDRRPVGTGTARAGGCYGDPAVAERQTRTVHKLQPTVHVDDLHDAVIKGSDSEKKRLVQLMHKTVSPGQRLSGNQERQLKAGQRVGRANFETCLKAIGGDQGRGPEPVDQRDHREVDGPGARYAPSRSRPIREKFLFLYSRSLRSKAQNVKRDCVAHSEAWEVQVLRNSAVAPPRPGQFQVHGNTFNEVLTRRSIFKLYVLCVARPVGLLLVKAGTDSGTGVTLRPTRRLKARPAVPA